MCDAELMKKLVNSDLVAAKKKRQFQCLTNFYKKYRSPTTVKSVKEKERYRKKGFGLHLSIYFAIEFTDANLDHNEFENP